jgi:GntR family transcriptional regulator/MocR family aminotransferase
VLLAFEQLRAEGYIVPRRGSGNYVATELPDEVPRAGTPIRRAAPIHPELIHPELAHPGLSQRGRLLAQARSPDRRAALAPRAFRLGTPAVDLFPSALWGQLARECLRSVSPARLDYSLLAGLPELREAIADQMASRGTSCTPEQVFVLAGAQRGLDLVFHLLTDAGDHVWMEDPGYPGAHGALLSAGARAACVPVDAEGLCVGHLVEGRWLEGSREIRVAYVTPSHQFPLGVPLSLVRRRKLLSWANAAQAWIVEDDYDCAFRYRARPLPCLHALAPDGRVIYVGTFSKTLFPALRLGFVIVPSDLIDAFTAARLATDLHPPVLEQSILAAFLLRGHYQRHVRRMQGVYAERLEALTTALERSGAPLQLRPVHSGLHAVADLEGADAESVARAAMSRNIEVMPLSAYGYGSTPDNALVLGFGSVRPAVLRVGAEQLAAAIEAVRQRPASSAGAR